jgi:hypothetical protein
MVRGSNLRDCQIAGKSLEPSLPPLHGNIAAVHQGNDLGYGKNERDWIICSQVLMVSMTYGCSPTTRWQSVLAHCQGLRYSLTAQRWVPEMKGLTSQELWGSHVFSMGLDKSYHRD